MNGGPEAPPPDATPLGEVADGGPGRQASAPIEPARTPGSVRGRRAVGQSREQSVKPSEPTPSLRIEDAINTACPWSGKPIREDSLTTYRGAVVGFCNPGCRDKFAAAVAAFEARLAK